VLNRVTGVDGAMPATIFPLADRWTAAQPVEHRGMAEQSGGDHLGPTGSFNGGSLVLTTLA
jgi:hypothetical protein